VCSDSQALQKSVYEKPDEMKSPEELAAAAATAAAAPGEGSEVPATAAAVEAVAAAAAGPAPAPAAAAAPASVAPAVATTPASAANSCAWTEFANESGKKYYYNAHTKTSVWEEPEELRVARARETAKAAGFAPSQVDQHQAHKAQAAAAAAMQNARATVVQQAKSPQAKTLIETVAATAPKPQVNTSVVDLSSKEPPKRKVKEYATKEEAVAAFKELLRTTPKIDSTMKWNEGMRLIISDPRWSALSSLGEKKQVFSEYTTQRAKVCTVRISCHLYKRALTPHP
jgi:hypothetical protein